MPKLQFIQRFPFIGLVKEKASISHAELLLGLDNLAMLTERANHSLNVVEVHVDSISKRIANAEDKQKYITEVLESLVRDIYFMSESPCRSLRKAIRAKIASDLGPQFGTVVGKRD